MEYARLGPTGLNVSPVCLGAALFGLAPLEEDAPALVNRALDLGINFFDVANSYGNRPSFDRPGLPTHDQRKSAEEIIGAILRPRRAEVVLASKLGEPIYDGPNGRGLSRVHVMRAAEDSLRRLGTDYIDLYYAHHPDPNTPIDETLRAMEDLIRAGKVRYFALSNYAGWQTAEAVLTARALGGAAAPVCNQVRYSLASRAVEREVVPACERFGLSVLPYSPLGGGLLSGAANTHRPIAGVQRWRGGGPGYTPEQVAVAERMDALGAEWGHHPTHLALAWLLAKPSVASVVIGASRVASLEEAAGAVDARLAPEQLETLDGVGVELTA